MGINARANPKYYLFPWIFGLFLIVGLLFIPTNKSVAAPPESHLSDALQQDAVIKPVYLPLVVRPLLTPLTPKLYPIENADRDNFFIVKWSPVEKAKTYTLQVAADLAFTNAKTAYEGPALLFDNTPGAPPSPYFYRVKANNDFGSSPWSETQTITIYPLHVGLNLRWDGKGIINIDGEENVGTHETARLDKMMDADIIQMRGRYWYDPDPGEWGSENYTSYYSISTGEFISSPDPGEPYWKWGYSWKLSYGASFSDGQTVYIGGQPFTVHGPIAGMTGIGFLNYWEFRNQTDIIYYEDEEGVTQFVHPGDAVLRYEYGHYGALVFDQIRRSAYYYDSYLGWVQYTTELTQIYSTPASSPKASITVAPENSPKLEPRWLRHPWR